jgi:putative transposase
MGSASRADVYREHAAALPPRRKQLRLATHNYAGGVYYVTQATQNRQRLFGVLLNGRMRLSPAGQMVHDVWREIPQCCPHYISDEFIVMPDHVHGIVRVHRDAVMHCRADDTFVGAPLRGRPSLRYHDYRRSRKGAPTEGRPDTDSARPDADAARPDVATLFDFMQRFKSLTTARYRHGVAAAGWPRFDGRLWQREYYEHIVRNDDAELRRIRTYIQNNPANANLLRFGELRYHGNRDLLKLRKTAFLASRSSDVRRGAPLWASDGMAHAQCVISGFLSPLERAVLHACRARNIPTIHVLACGRIQDDQPGNGRLVITPFDPDIATINAARAAWCNQYVLENADEIVIGNLKPDGMLAFLLADLPRDTPVTILPEEEPAAGAKKPDRAR